MEIARLQVMTVDIVQTKSYTEVTNHNFTNSFESTLLFNTRHAWACIRYGPFISDHNIIFRKQPANSRPWEQPVIEPWHEFVSKLNWYPMQINNPVYSMVPFNVTWYLTPPCDRTWRRLDSLRFISTHNSVTKTHPLGTYCRSGIPPFETIH